MEIIRNPHYRSLTGLIENGDNHPGLFRQITPELLFGADEMIIPAGGMYEIVRGYIFIVGHMAKGRGKPTRPILLSSAGPGDVVDTRLDPLNNSYLSDLFAPDISIWSPLVVEGFFHNINGSECDESSETLAQRAQQFCDANLKEVRNRIEKLFEGEVTYLQAGAALILALQQGGRIDASKERMAQCTFCPSEAVFGKTVIKQLVEKNILAVGRNPYLQRIDPEKLEEIIEGSKISPDDFRLLRPLNKRHQ